jgi:hypothetical protein
MILGQKLLFKKFLKKNHRRMIKKEKKKLRNQRKGNIIYTEK